VEELRQRVEEEWDRLDQEVIDNAISEWRESQHALQPAEIILNIQPKYYCTCSHTD